MALSGVKIWLLIEYPSSCDYNCATTERAVSRLSLRSWSRAAVQIKRLLVTVRPMVAFKKWAQAQRVSMRSKTVLCLRPCQAG